MLVLVSVTNVHARYIKKIVVEPLMNPIDWQKSFKPGTVFSNMLESSLAKSGRFQIIRSTKSPSKKRALRIFENKQIIKEENQGIEEKEIKEVAKKEKLDRPPCTTPSDRVG